MPRLRANVGFPSPARGWMYIESPVGATVFEQAYENITSLSKELSTTTYSAYVLINGGVSGSGTPSGSERIGSQKVTVVVTPGVSNTFSNILKTKPTVSTSSGATVSLPNKVRTKVSVSVS